MGLPTDLTVTSIPDTRPPAVTSIAFSPANIDVSAGSRNITVDLTLTDDLSGVDFSASRFLEFRMTFRSPSGRQQQYSSAPDFQLVSGNVLNGAWRVVHAFPQFSEPGMWTIASLNLIDIAGNQVSLNTAALQGLGLPATFTVFSAPADTTPPQVTSFAFTPAVIDTSAGSALVTVTMTISDDLSGADFSGDGSNVTLLHGAQFVSPSGLQARNTGAFTRTGGTTLNGTWQSTIFFPQFSEAGTWLATLFGIKDVVHNTSNLSTAALVSNGFPTQLVIFQPSQAPDGTVGSAGGTVIDSVFGTRATIMFPPGTLPSSTSVAIDVLGTSLGLPTPQGFSGGTLFVNVNLSPTPPMPFGAPGLTVTLPIATFRTPGSLINLYRLDPTTGLLVPAISVTNTNVVGTVNADGLSATFTGVSHLSTLVGFFPTALVGDVNRDGVVTCADLAIVKASLGRRSGQLGFDSRADVNSNGVVDINDLALVSRQLPAGTTCQ